MPTHVLIIRRIPSVLDRSASFGRMRQPTSVVWDLGRAGTCGTVLGRPKPSEAQSDPVKPSEASVQARAAFRTYAQVKWDAQRGRCSDLGEVLEALVGGVRVREGR